MKTIALLLTSLCATAAFGQSISYVPRQFAAFVSSDGTGNPGTWNPLTGTGGTAISFVPQPIGIYYSTDGTGNPGTWAPWKGTSSGGASLSTSNIFTANGALSTPAALWNGTPVTSGGSGTTTWPLVLIQPNGTTSTVWNTAGTMFGVNSPSGFTGSVFDFEANGSSVLKLSPTGTLTGSGSVFSVYQTGSNCANAASPAVCAAAAAGSVAVPAGTNPTLTVDTSRVTANSQIMLTEDQSLGARLSVTCQTAADPTWAKVTARTAGTSFTFQITGTFTTNPVCYSYTIIN